MNLKKALRYSEIKHGNQMYGEKPYMYHINSVVELAEKLGYSEEIQVCCALHDVLEDTETTPQDILTNFGVQVFEVVWAVTDADGDNRSTKKQNTYPKIKSSWKSTVVKILDRVCNIEACLELENEEKFIMYQREHKELFDNVKSKDHSNLVVPAWKEYGKFYGLSLDPSFKMYINSMSN